MKKSALVTLLSIFITSSVFAANQIINVPKKFGTQTTQEWFLTGPTEAIMIQNSAPINVIIYPLMRDVAGALLNGLNVVCNNTGVHVNAGSFITCHTSDNVSWASDDVIPGAWSVGSVTIGFQGIKK
ncbi:MAG: hypothetical protein A3F11_09090 [Gammaproteobacteria bacterium RIFCSPHIGHO2_12_FULL_37_14]|nr:MAG: hypothetical protein A3F11_09090 [Gammaproteobacteria bacterium RIFCSPHIGHO2_12_FULL_37_14]